MSETKISWSAIESESIEPFKTSSKGLESCALRLSPSESFDKSDTRVITTPDFWTDFQPALRIEADLDELASATGLDSDGIMVSVEGREFVENLVCGFCPYDRCSVGESRRWLG